MKKPYITLKFAQTLDGKIAAGDGSSRWISGPQSRKFTHKLRADSDAVLVGARTILADDPSLTVRLVKGRNPARVIIDGRLRTPLGARVVTDKNTARTIIVTAPSSSRAKRKRLKELGVEVIVLPASKGGNIDLRKIIRILYKKGIKKILIEGGSRVITSFLKAGLADRIVTVLSPKILGTGIESVGDMGIRNIKGALKVRLKDIKQFGEDIVYIAYISK
jgi:riboflavin-specific deaminase-like protein